MFDFLKKKISTFAEKLTRKEQESVTKKEDTPPVYNTSDEEKKPEEALAKKIQKRSIQTNVSIAKKVQCFFTGKTKLTEKDIETPLFELELALLESDVEQETAQEIVTKLKEKIKEKEITRNENATEFIKQKIKETLSETMQTQKISILQKTQEKKPLIILMLGPNGAGKTTTIAKITHLMQKNGKAVVIASADTFRAGSIEQINEHAKKLNARLIKHHYGADPAAVAYDAIKSAQAQKEDVVLIDTAGRQDTNKNLLKELEKIIRVAKPDLKIYVGEAYTGQALLQQATEFNNTIGIDGFILTKIDTDTKGGTAISLLHKLKKPILYIGTGQKYEDLAEFEKEYIIDRIV
jgi:fused signal recognition particle receptor